MIVMPDPGVAVVAKWNCVFLIFPVSVYVSYLNIHAAILSAQTTVSSAPKKTSGLNLFRELVFSRSMTISCEHQEPIMSSMTFAHAVERISSPSFFNGLSIKVMRVLFI